MREENMKKNIHIYHWIAVLYTWNKKDSIDQQYFNQKKKKKKKHIEKLSFLPSPGPKYAGTGYVPRGSHCH